MGIAKTVGLFCDECGESFTDWEFSSAKAARREARETGWAVDGKKLYCPDCAKTIALATKPPEAPVVEVPARWVRGGVGSHWEGCYSVHWDCAIRELRWQLFAALPGAGRGAEAVERARKVYLETGNE